MCDGTSKFQSLNYQPGANGLANFFLIDHSLIEPGGHHADYAKCVARAANQMGFLTTIGANKRLQNQTDLDQIANVSRVFAQTTYQKDSYISGVKQLTRCKYDYLGLNPSPQSFLRRAGHAVRHFRHQSRREKFIQQFARDCEKLFAGSLFTEGDHAFFTTVSELELLGLAAYLANQPRTLQVHWHLQFHFNLFDGRPPEYKKQNGLARAVQSCFDSALARIPYHAVHFYTTTETLADQYNRLGVGQFTALPYPIAQQFYNSKAENNTTSEIDAPDNKTNDGPLRITCPGQIRREKGQTKYLQTLVDQIHEAHLTTGNVKLVVQRQERSWPARKKIDLQFPQSEESFTDDKDFVDYLPHPLNEVQYADLIKSADCGLLFYDSQAYFSRRAGVLGELLSSGTPVIVPAGSWLSEQIRKPMQRHLQQLSLPIYRHRSLPLDQCIVANNNVPHPGGIVSFDNNRHPFRFQFQPTESETGFVLQFDWQWPDKHGTYCEVKVEQMDEDGQPISESSQIVGKSRSDESTRVLFRILPNATQISIQMKNAFDRSTASAKNLAVQTLTHSHQVMPVSSVGIIAANEADLPRCVTEFVTYSSHYRESAQQFAKSWYSLHEPNRTVAHLLSREKLESKVA